MKHANAYSVTYKCVLCSRNIIQYKRNPDHKEQNFLTTKPWMPGTLWYFHWPPCATVRFITHPGTEDGELKKPTDQEPMYPWLPLPLPELQEWEIRERAEKKKAKEEKERITSKKDADSHWSSQVERLQHSASQLAAEADHLKGGNVSLCKLLRAVETGRMTAADLKGNPTRPWDHDILVDKRDLMRKHHALAKVSPEDAREYQTPELPKT